MTDWEAIQADYEQGASLRKLEAQYGISKSTIERHAKVGQWDNGTMGRDRGTLAPPPSKPVQLPIPVDAVSIARIGLQQLAKHLQDAETLLEIRDHKSLSDALAQYVKVLVTAPRDEPEHEEGVFIPLDKISAHTRLEIRRLLAEDEQAQAQEKAG